MTLIGAGYGAYRLLDGRKLKEYGRANATEPKW
jgi:hypothetical protein